MPLPSIIRGGWNDSGPVAPNKFPAPSRLSPKCRKSWRSHACDLDAGHEGDHVCDPCPPGCDLGFGDPELRADAEDRLDLSPDECAIHCNDKPMSGDRVRG